MIKPNVYFDKYAINIEMKKMKASQYKTEHATVVEARWSIYESTSNPLPLIWNFFQLLSSLRRVSVMYQFFIKYGKRRAVPAPGLGLGRNTSEELKNAQGAEDVL